jgi:predicted dinucleotide-binding enzyme
MLYYGDDQAAKAVAARLVRDVEFNPVDAGALRMARYAEPFASLVAHLAYEGTGGPELAYRFERLRK